jgi:exosortase
MSENAAVAPTPSPASDDKGTSLLHEFVQEAPGVWRQIPRKSLFGILLLAWAALFHLVGSPTFGYTKAGSLFVWLKGCYDTSPDDQHGLIMPIVVFFLLWMKRKELLEVIGKTWWPGLFYLAFAGLFHFAAYRVQQERFSVLAFIFGLHALIGVVWGPHWIVRTIFPLGLLIFCVPLTNAAELITFPLRMFVTKVSVGIGHEIFGIGVFQDGSRILDIRGRPLYDVAPACSGMRSLIAMAALSVIYAFLNFRAPWKRLLIIVCALPMAVLGNIARISTVILVGEALGLPWGMMIEQKFGFLTFAVAIGGMVGVGWLLRDKTEKAPAPQATKTEQRAQQPVEISS